MSDTNYILTQHFTPIGDNKLESLIGEKPETKTSYLIFFIHGFNHFGGWESLFLLPGIIKEGWTAVLPSQPGFGNSTGARDYCGPSTCDSIAKAIEDISSQLNISPEKRIIWGVSRGAIVTSLLAGRYPDIAAGFICQSGCYDFKKDFEREDKDPKIKENIIEETNGANEESLQERSVINIISSITKPILILHGNTDTTINVEQADIFAQALEKENKQNELQIVEAGHPIGKFTRNQFIFPFIKKIFGL